MNHQKETDTRRTKDCALESSGTMTQSLAGAEATRRLTDGGGNRSAKSFIRFGQSQSAS